MIKDYNENTLWHLVAKYIKSKAFWLIVAEDMNLGYVASRSGILDEDFCVANRFNVVFQYQVIQYNQ